MRKGEDIMRYVDVSKNYDNTVMVHTCTCTCSAPWIMDNGNEHASVCNPQCSTGRKAQLCRHDAIQMQK